MQVGIYGYTAYSASKFGLRGLAEALQQEVIGDDIHISVIFPPDTDTPGLAEGTYKDRPVLLYCIVLIVLTPQSGFQYFPGGLEYFLLSFQFNGLY